MVILYNSYSGYSYKFASLLAKALDLSIYSIDNINKIPKGEDIIFFTCVHNDIIMKLDIAKKLDLALVCVVGAMPYSLKNISKLKQKNNINEFYYFEGGISKSEIGLISRLKLSLLAKRLNKKLKNNELDEYNMALLNKILKNDKDCDFSSIGLIIDWYYNFEQNKFVS